jgi:transposase
MARKPTGPKPPLIRVCAREIRILKKIEQARETPQGLALRARIILLARRRFGNSRIARICRCSRKTVILWRKRYYDIKEAMEALLLSNATDLQLRKLILHVFSDEPRTGKPVRITAEQKIAIIAMACEKLPQIGIPQSQWDAPLIAREAACRGIIASISESSINRILDSVDLHPHRIWYWLNAGVDANSEELFKIPAREICDIYRNARDLHAKGIHVISIDECTGIQALEPTVPDKLSKPGKVLRREVNYIRHGTRCLIGNLEIATGRMLIPSILGTRTESDFVAHIWNLLVSDPNGEWRFICDGLNTHKSELLVRMVAEVCGITTDLGIKGQNGILKSLKSRAAFLHDPTHRIRFVFTPVHCSWLNQVEIWFGTLRKKLLKRGSFESVEDLTNQLKNFIEYYNRYDAHPYRWTWAGAPLKAA